MMTPIFLDIEVLQHNPAPWMVREQREICAPKNYKDPDKIREYVAKKVREQLDELRAQASLMPDGPLLGGTVCVVGVAVGRCPVRVRAAPTGDEAGERWLLERLQRALDGLDRSQHRLVTFGGTDYDLPFLAKRALRHGLNTLSQWCFKEKPWSEGHVDLRRIWCMGDRQARGRLTDLAQWLGIPITNTTRGSDVQALWNAGGPDGVAAHAGADVELTREIYWRFRAAGWVRGTDEVPERAPRRCDDYGPAAQDAAEATPDNVVELAS